MGWLKRINYVLSLEPETWLTYIYGQQFESLKYLQGLKPRYRGKYLRLAIWIYLLLRQARFRSKPVQGECDYLFFAGTLNQKNSLATTLDTFKTRGIKVRAIAPKSIITQDDDSYEAMAISFLGVVKCIILALVRAKSLSTQLKQKSELLTVNRLDNFLNSYNALVYFDDILNKLKPRFVIVSNDHNTMNRSLIALARNAGIETVYMQHASVSNLFPALNFDYAFLDGQSALITYRECENNCPCKTALQKNRKVYLTGQKKKVKAEIKTTEIKSKEVGIALNALDSLEGAERLVVLLENNGVKVRLRWHPALATKVTQILKTRLSSREVEFSDPKLESLGSFFSKISCLVAGNSSIHLEAALAHVVPIHYEVSQQYTNDYYGYVKNGLSINARDFSSLLDILKLVGSGDLSINKNAVQFYSSTFGTEWDGREGELVAECLIALDRGDNPPISSNNLVD